MDPGVGVRLAAAALGWLGGIAVQLQSQSLAARWQVAVLALAAMALLLRPHGAWRAWRLAVGLGLLGFSCATLQAEWRLAEAVPGALEGEDLLIEGVVATLPQATPTGVRFIFDVERALHDGQPVTIPRRVLLARYQQAGAGAHGASPAAPVPQSPDGEVFRAGERWRLPVRLRHPHGNSNPWGFDHELHLFEQGVRATGSVQAGRRTATAVRLDDRGDRPVERLRQQVRDAIHRTVPEPGPAGVLAALSVGDQSAIARADWQVFRDAGVAHLVSISGLHVTMFAWLAGAALRRAWAHHARASLYLPAPTAGWLGGAAAAVAYAVFSGWGVPAQRTVWMLLVVTVLRCSGRHWPWPQVLLLAASVVALLDPWALLQPGFWLSFVAVGLLMLSGSPQLTADSPPAGASGWLRTALRSQLVATVGLTPLTLVFFQQVSLVGFAANLLAIPLVTLVITPLALLGVAWAPLWTLGAWVTSHGTAALAVLAQAPWAVWSVAVAPAWAQWAALAGAALVVAPLPWRLRWLAAPLVLPLCVPPVERPASGAFEVLAVDVGQGTAVLVRTHRHLLVYDAGPQYSPFANAGERVLVPLLRARGERRIHQLMLSHRDIDHVGGAEALFDAMPVDALLSSLEPGHALLGRAGMDDACEWGQAWEWDGVSFEVLHPPARELARPIKPNAKSCVLRVSAAQGSLLLAGDIERAQEARLVAAAVPLASDVLLVPHHGSRTSSTSAFLDAVRPSVAIVQAGYRNRFGHPAPEVLARYAERGVRVMDSPACGAWQWRGPAPPAQGQCHRPAVRRYWHHAPSQGSAGSARISP
ncbi:DNA internalization-related competence protein ComEC/Rec2 [Rhizobacter sp. LjRoot28]|uniref:DNA internalization-related competence protein ComEC/Rec2 n=1 Tax=Rhizobacter sp. LjRoot28 TaxID=3342309 RepID=UPI003ECD035D